MQAGREREGALKARIGEVEKSEADGVERERVLQSEGVTFFSLQELLYRTKSNGFFLPGQEIFGCDGQARCGCV